MTGVGRDNHRWVLPRGSTSGEGFVVRVTPERAGWQHTGLHVAELPAAGAVTLDLPGTEAVVVPLAGAVSVAATWRDGRTRSADLAGRVSPFTGRTDTAYVSAGSRLRLSAAQGAPARVAVCGARAPDGGARVPDGGEDATLHVLPRAEVPVELRGAGLASRQVHGFGLPGALPAARRLLVCEVLTPGGCWSSYPPHKHDEERPGEETALEEIYYFEVAGPTGRDTDPVAYHRVYGSERRPIDVVAEVRTGDVVLVPYGWHGPATAPPGYDLYYLNVMAGPGPERAWRISDDPAHAWVRDTWAGQQVDPRLPLHEGAS